MSSTLDQIYLLLQKQQAASQSQRQQIQQHQQQQQQTVLAPSPSPIYPGGTTPASVARSTTAATLPVASASDSLVAVKKFSFKGRTQQQQQQQVATMTHSSVSSSVLAADGCSSSRTQKEKEDVAGRIADLFIEALAIHVGRDDDDGGNETRNSDNDQQWSLVDGLGVLQQRFGAQRRSLLLSSAGCDDDDDADRRKATTAQQRDDTSRIDSKSVVASAFSVPSLKAALFKFLADDRSKVGDSTTQQRQRLVHAVWEALLQRSVNATTAAVEVENRRRERNGDDDAEVEEDIVSISCADFRRVFSSLREERNMEMAEEKTAIRMLVANSPSARKFFFHFLFNHTCPSSSSSSVNDSANGDQLSCKQLLISAAPLIVSAVASPYHHQSHFHHHPLLQLVVERAGGGDRRFIGGIDPHIASSVFSELLLEGERGDDDEKNNNRDYRNNNNNKNPFHLLLRAFRSKLASNNIPSRLVKELQELDSASRSAFVSPPSPSSSSSSSSSSLSSPQWRCATLSVFNVPAGMAAVEEVGMSLDVASELVSILRRDLLLMGDVSSSSSSSVTTQERERMLLRARTALLFAPVHAGEKQAMMMTAVVSNSNNGEPDPENATAKSLFHSALSTAAQIVVKCFRPPPSPPAPSAPSSHLATSAAATSVSFKQRFVDCICALRAVMHASATGAPRKADPQAMLQAVHNLMVIPSSPSSSHSSPAAATTLLVRECPAVLPFLLECLLGALEVVVWAASLHEHESHSAGSDDQSGGGGSSSGSSGVVVAATSYLASALQAKKFFDALLGAGSGSDAEEDSATSNDALFGGDDDDNDDDEHNDRLTATRGKKPAPIAAVPVAECLLQMIPQHSFSAKSSSNKNMFLLSAQLKLHFVRWIRTFIFAVGRSEPAGHGSTGGGSALAASSSSSASAFSSSGFFERGGGARSGVSEEDLGAWQALLIGRLDALVVSDSAVTSTGGAALTMTDEETVLFLCLVMQELLGSRIEQVRITLAGLCGDRAQLRLGQLVTKIVQKVVAILKMKRAEKGGEDSEEQRQINTFLTGVVTELAQLLPAEESNTLLCSLG